eukprot:gene90-123_t
MLRHMLMKKSSLKLLSRSSPFISQSMTTVGSPFRLFSNIPESDTSYQSEVEDLRNMYIERAKRRQSMVGKVVSTKCAKSITVQVHHDKFYSKYNKMMSVRKKFMAHDEDSLAKDGDLVRITPCRPMSRRKRHKLIDIIKKSIDVDFTDLKPTSPILKKTQMNVEAYSKDLNNEFKAFIFTIVKTTRVKNI